MKKKPIPYKTFYASVFIILMLSVLITVNIQDKMDSGISSMAGLFEKISKMIVEQFTDLETNESTAEQESEIDKSNADELADFNKIFEEMLNQTDEDITAGAPSFAFAGRKSLNEILGIGSTSASTDSSESGEENAGDNEVLSGEVPELTIELGSQQLENIAQRFGYLLVAVTDEAIVGKIIGGELQPITQAEIDQYSRRGRDASVIQEYDRLITGVANHINVKRSDIRLYYLVPIQVENRFIEFQIQEIRNAGLKPDQVRLMIARYTMNTDLELVQIIDQ